MKRTMRMMLVLGLLAAGLSARAAHAQEPVGLPDEPMWAELGEDVGDAGPMMGQGAVGHGPGMGSGAMGHGPGMGRRARHMRNGMGLGPAFTKELNLTPEQREKMKASHERQQRKAIQARADMQIARLDLHKLMQAEKPDARAIDAQIDRIAGLRSGLQKSRVATMLEFRASLTPEQQKKLRELREKGPQVREQRQNRGRQGGDM